MGLWFLGGFECNREEPLDDIKHSIYLHLKHPLTSHKASQCKVDNQCITASSGTITSSVEKEKYL